MARTKPDLSKAERRSLEEAIQEAASALSDLGDTLKYGARPDLLARDARAVAALAARLRARCAAFEQRERARFFFRETGRWPDSPSAT